jgi:hypothetical protein
MTSQVIPVGSNVAVRCSLAFSGRAAVGDGRRRHSRAAAAHRLLAAYQVAVAILLLTMGLIGMTAIGSGPAADATQSHGPTPGFAQ